MQVGTVIYVTENNNSIASGIIIAKKGTRYVIRIGSGRGISFPESSCFIMRNCRENAADQRVSKGRTKTIKE